MPIRDVEAMNASLDNDYDSTDMVLALFDGDPTDGGVEVTDVDCPGYGRAAVPASAWSPAADGQKSTTGPVSFPDATGGWSLFPSHYLLLDAATESVGWDYQELTEVLEVTEAGPFKPVAVTVYVEESIEPLT